MIRFMSLSSGSCGNCYYLGTDRSGILIDAGVSLRKLKKGLEDAGLSMDSFGSILVTHDHMDHIRHLGSYCKKLIRPVYTTDILHRALSVHSFTRDFFPNCGRVLEAGKWNVVEDFGVRYFEVPHDATQTVGYAIVCGSYKFVIITDAGRITDEAVSFARQADTVVVESNYDVDMLMGGSYTYDLKMRISGGIGHMSNDDCAAAIVRFLHPGLRNIFLCHLSENNNTPKLAYDCSYAALSEAVAARNEADTTSAGADTAGDGADTTQNGTDAGRDGGDTIRNGADTASGPDSMGNPQAAGTMPLLRCLPRTYPSPLFTLGE